MANRRTFTNLDDVKLTTTFMDVLKWQKMRRGIKKDISYIVPHAKNKKIDFLTTNQTLPTITWIGHCTFLIQKNGLTIVTDPVWANRMGFAKRLTSPGIEMDQLPPIDVVLISHNHYDHLDIGSLRKLKGDPLILVPIGIKNVLHKKGFTKVEEYNWWSHKSLPMNNIEFHFVPAQHWSKRSLTDTNRSHWGGWVINDSLTNKDAIYFVGDSGYFRGFQLIGERFDIEYMLVPIGAYEPEWFMNIQHVNPEQAVQAYLDAKATYFIPMHHDAFQLGDDTSKEALDRLHREWQRLELANAKLKLPNLGETFLL